MTLGTALRLRLRCFDADGAPASPSRATVRYRLRGADEVHEAEALPGDDGVLVCDLTLDEVGVWAVEARVADPAVVAGGHVRVRAPLISDAPAA